MTSEHYPKEANLGKDCLYWDVDAGCTFPKVEIQGRRSCEGVIDDVCLFIKDGRLPQSLTEDQIAELRTRKPDLEGRPNLPPGEIV